MQITKSSVGCRDVIACSSSTCNTTAICHCLSPGSETWPCKHINFNYIRVIYFDIHTEVSGIRAFTDTASYNQQMPVLEMAVDREAAGWVMIQPSWDSGTASQQSSLCLSQAVARSFLFGMPCTARRAGQLLGKGLCWVQDLLGWPRQKESFVPPSTALPSSVFARFVSQPAGKDQTGLRTCLSSVAQREGEGFPLALSRRAFSKPPRCNRLFST